jgi:hypothetical protein
MPGDLIVNRIPEEKAELKLGYKLALGEVVKSGIDAVEEGATVVFALKDAREWDLPPGEDWGFQPSPLGVFQLREGDLRFQIKRRS